MANTPNNRFNYRRNNFPPAADNGGAGRTVPAGGRSADTSNVIGDPKLWTTLQRAKDPATGMTKTTRAMEVPGGVLVNTCTRGANFATEALVFIPGARVLRDAATKTGTLVNGA